VGRNGIRHRVAERAEMLTAEQVAGMPADYAQCSSRNGNG
jgi:hypothetical protein